MFRRKNSSRTNRLQTYRVTEISNAYFCAADTVTAVRKYVCGPLPAIIQPVRDLPMSHLHRRRWFKVNRHNLWPSLLMFCAPACESGLYIVYNGECAMFQLFWKHDNEWSKMYKEIKSRIIIAKAAFKTKRKILFTRKLGLSLLKKVLKCYICSKAVCVWCWNLDNAESRSEIPGKFWNMVLEKEDQLDGSREQWSFTMTQGGEEYLSNNKKEEG
jgi:hypothetical protein